MFALSSCFFYFFLHWLFHYSKFLQTRLTVTVMLCAVFAVYGFFQNPLFRNIRCVFIQMFLQINFSLCTCLSVWKDEKNTVTLKASGMIVHVHMCFFFSHNSSSRWPGKLSKQPVACFQVKLNANPIYCWVQPSSGLHSRPA